VPGATFEDCEHVHHDNIRKLAQQRKGMDMSIWMSAPMGLEATLGNTVKQGAAMFVPSGAGSTHADTGDCRRLSWSARPVAVSPETLLAPCVHWHFFYLRPLFTLLRRVLGQPGRRRERRGACFVHRTWPRLVAGSSDGVSDFAPLVRIRLG
jgi:hypothetical protein